MKRSGIFILLALLFSTQVFAKDNVAVFSIVISPEEAFVTIGEKFKFTLNAYDLDSNVEPLSNVDIIWTVSENIGEIVNNSKKNPLFIATAEGSGCVIAKLGDLTTSAPVTVISGEPEPELVTISGMVTGATEVAVTLSGDVDVDETITVDEDGGSYKFAVVHGGNYTVTPSRIGYTFEPESIAFENVTSDHTRQDFTAKKITYEDFFFKVKERGTFTVFGMPFPLNSLNGMKLYFPKGSLPYEDVTITFRLPTFADVDNDNKDISFYGDIISAVSFL